MLREQRSRKTFIFALLAAVLIFSGSALAEYPTTENPSPNLDRIVKSGKLVVGTHSGLCSFPDGSIRMANSSVIT